MSTEGRGKESKKSQQQAKPIHTVDPLLEPAPARPDYAQLAGGADKLDPLLADGRLGAVQRQEIAMEIGRLSGNAHLANVLQQKRISLVSGPTPAVQRTNGDPPGHGQSTPYGTYWIVPDDTNQSYTGVTGEQITESAFALLTQVWNDLQSGSGKLSITEKDKDGKDHAGFKANMLKQFGLLLSMPTGRSVVMNLMLKSNFNVTIRPHTGKLYGGGQATRVHGADALEKGDGTAGKGSGTIIDIDPTLTDTDIKVNDKDGNEISDPVFIIVGHELIHAQHNAEGRNKRSQPAVGGGYSNKEEEETVATGPTTENMLRSEHGLKGRAGSGGRDTRPGL